MRRAVLLLLLAGCGPRVKMESSPFEHDDVRAGAPAPQPKRFEELPVTPPGPGVRESTIDRARLLETLDAGPGEFLRGFEVTPDLDEQQRFRGWRLVQLMPGEHRFAGLDLLPGDVLVAINGQTLSRPDQLQSLWESLRTAAELVCDVERAETRFQLRFAIVPPPEESPVPEVVPVVPGPTPNIAPGPRLLPSPSPSPKPSPSPTPTPTPSPTPSPKPSPSPTPTQKR